MQQSYQYQSYQYQYQTYIRLGTAKDLYVRIYKCTYEYSSFYFQILISLYLFIYFFFVVEGERMYESSRTVSRQ